MTAQDSDQFRFEGHLYSVAAIEKTWPFEPRRFGFTPVSPHTGSWRGFLAVYAIEEGHLILDTLDVCMGESAPRQWMGLDPEQGESFQSDRMWQYKDVRLPVPYSGGIVLGSGFLDEFYEHMGFQAPYAYEIVKELIFDDGRLMRQTDHSQRMAATRERIREKKMSFDPGMHSFEEANRVVRALCSLSYADKWN